MPKTKASSQLAVELPSQPYSVLRKLTGNLNSRNDFRPALKNSSTRLWASLQNHAVSLLPTTPGGANTTPDPDDRRKGYNWDVAQQCDRGTEHPRMPSAKEPKGTARWLQDSVELTLTNTTSGGIAGPLGGSLGGVRREVQDLRIFDPGQNEEPHVSEERLPKPIRKAGYKLKFKLPPALKRAMTAEGKTKKRAHFSGVQDKSATSPKPRKAGIKGRKKIGQAEPMTPTPPLELSDIAPRSRSPVSKHIDLQDIAPQRSRSPETPWIRHNTPGWPLRRETGTSASADREAGHGHVLLPGTDVIRSLIPPAREPRDCCPIPRPRNRRNRSGTNDDSQFRTPDSTDSPAFQPVVILCEELTQLGNKRSKRWRWARQWASTDADSPAVDSPDKRPSLSQSLQEQVQPPPTALITASCPSLSYLTSPKSSHKTRRKQHSSKKYKDQIANLPVPPAFTPPGTSRVPSTPTLDNDVEVKERIAGFYFAVHGPERPKRSSGILGGEWDSDALLMPRSSNIPPSGSSSYESTQGPSPHAPTPRPIYEATTSNFTSPSRHPSPSFPPSTSPGFCELLDPQSHFSVRLSDNTTSDDEMSADERAKLEWWTPEHFPSSPLCPLNEKYRGLTKGICVYHGRGESSMSDGG